MAEGLEKPDCQNHDIVVHCANIGYCMTLLCGMLQMQEDPGVRLGMVAWLKCCEVTMLVGEHGLEAGTQEELPAHVSLGDMCADE